MANNSESNNSSVIFGFVMYSLLCATCLIFASYPLYHQLDIKQMIEVMFNECDRILKIGNIFRVARYSSIKEQLNFRTESMNRNPSSPLYLFIYSIYTR